MFITQEDLDFYYSNLRTINGIAFTPRQIDVMACIINGMTNLQEIANLLSIVRGVAEKHQGDIKRILRSYGNKTETNIRKFIEKSDKHSLLRKHYAYLLRVAAFETTLRQIARKINPSQAQAKISLYCVRDKDTKFLIDNGKRLDMRNHLQLAGYSADVRDIRNANINDITDEINNGIKIVFVISEGFIVEFNENKNIKTLLEHASRLTIQDKNSDKRGHILLCSIKDSIPGNIISTISNIEQVTIKDDYCVVVLELLVSLSNAPNRDTKNVEITSAISAFKTNYPKDLQDLERLLPHINRYTKTDHFLLFLTHGVSNKVWKIFLCAVLIISICSVVIYKQYRKGHVSDAVSGQHIKSDLVIPVETALLERPYIIKQMSDKLRGSQGIKTIALTGIVGMGGAGKTTMARYYGKNTTDASIVWELNAESKETVMNSVKELAYRLANTSGLKKELEFIQQIQNSNLQEKQLVNFVKIQLKECANWVLIYDNLENFNVIMEYFPQDIGQWGNGRVIITTRNQHIAETSHIKPEDIIHIDQLSVQEMVELFSKISHNSMPDKLTQVQVDEITTFLKNIPPFPLDVSVAAHYLKVTNTSFAQYLKYLNNYNANFDNTQVYLLKEIGDYTRTRFNIITLSIQHLVKLNSNFKDLLIFVSLLDSQDIPKSLLNQYNEPALVDGLMVHLDKYSLITHSNSSTLLGPVFSMHRSTRDIMYAFLKTSLDFRDYASGVQRLSDALYCYVNNIVDQEDFTKIHMLLSHANTFVNNTEEFKNRDVMLAKTILGIIYYKLGDDVKGKQILEQSLVNNGCVAEVKDIKYANGLAHLGNIYRRHGEWNKAQKILSSSIECYRNLKNDFGMATALIFLGSTYTDCGYYGKANKTLEESLEIYKRYYKTHIRTGWALVHLAHLYSELAISAHPPKSVKS